MKQKFLVQKIKTKHIAIGIQLMVVVMQILAKNCQNPLKQINSAENKFHIVQ